ncbi:MAG: DUF2190 family protein [Paracoccus sp. (in: a-proteobacteria)]|nr:DUF2190 family protein [Paracoccus sp. (in: a-proteobacteria)]
MIPIFIRAYHAPGEIRSNRIVAFSDAANGNDIAEATGASDVLIGVSDRMGAAAGGMCDVHRLGLAATLLGGAVSAGDPVSADAEGRAVKATTGRIIGYADEPGAEGDIIDVWLVQTSL